MNMTMGESCEDYYIRLLEGKDRRAFLGDLRFLHFVVQFDLRRVFECVGAENFPEDCMEVALRHRRTELFHRLFVHSRAHAELQSGAHGGLRAGRVLLMACREGATDAVQLLLRYPGVPKTAVDGGKNCVHHLLEHRLYLLMDHFLDEREVWTPDIVVHLVFHSHTYFIRELIRRNYVEDVGGLRSLAHAPAMRATLQSEWNRKNARTPQQADG